MYLKRAETWRGLAECFERPKECGKEFRGNTEPCRGKIGVGLATPNKKQCGSLVKGWDHFRANFQALGHIYVVSGVQGGKLTA
jgi:hypothetical protein